MVFATGTRVKPGQKKASETEQAVQPVGGYPIVPLPQPTHDELSLFMTVGNEQTSRVQSLLSELTPFLGSF
jgi:hypothetical protein